MFSAETERLVNELIQAEYKNACEQFGDKYNSLHEGYAVLLEEAEEVLVNWDSLNTIIDQFWQRVKNSCNVDYDIKVMLEDVQSAIKELAQVGAVLMKIQNTISEVEE